jgi:hypothetical protein
VLTVTHLLYIDAMASTAKDQTCLHSARKFPCLLRDLFLVFAGEIDKVVILCANEERYCSLESCQQLYI